MSAYTSSRNTSRKPESITSFEMDDLSESMTLASVETSSTTTAYTASADDHDYYPKPSLTSSQGDPTLLGLLRAVATSEEPEGRQRALAAVFSFIHDGQTHMVIQSLAHCGQSRDLILEQLASYRPTPLTYEGKRGRFRYEKPTEWTTDLCRHFLTELLRYFWDSATYEEAEKWCSFFGEEHSILKYLFPSSAKERTKTPLRVDIVHIYFARPGASWPSLVNFEETQFRHVPTEWPVSNIARILPERDTPAMSALLDYILKSTKPNSNCDPAPAAIVELDELLGGHRERYPIAWSTAHFLRRHPASHSLWLALYLASGNSYAAKALVSGGIVTHLRDLYDLDFPDPRPNSDAATQGVYDLLRISYMLLRVLFRDNKNANVRSHALKYPTSTGKKCLSAEDDTWIRAKELADELKENMREELRYYARQMTARYHDSETVYRDEIEAEARDQRFLSQLK